MSRKILLINSHCDDNVYANAYEVSLNETLKYEGMTLYLNFTASFKY